MKTAVVNSKELGTNCWSTHRFCGGRCNRIMYCKYPEKQTCLAVQAEIEFIKQSIEQIEQITNKALEALEQHEAFHKKMREIGHSILAGREE